MKITLNELTVNDRKVLEYLDSYLDKMSKHSNFNEEMTLKVYANSKNDFTAFEAKDYRLNFVSSSHKLMETIKSKSIMDYVTFKDFRSKVSALMQAS